MNRREIVGKCVELFESENTLAIISSDQLIEEEASCVDRLNEDALCYIFACLAPRELVKITGVCKYWSDVAMHCLSFFGFPNSKKAVQEAYRKQTLYPSLAAHLMDKDIIKVYLYGEEKLLLSFLGTELQQQIEQRQDYKRFKLILTKQANDIDIVVFVTEKITEEKFFRHPNNSKEIFPISKSLSDLLAKSLYFVASPDQLKSDDLSMSQIAGFISLDPANLTRPAILQEFSKQLLDWLTLLSQKKQVRRHSPCVLI